MKLEFEVNRQKVSLEVPAQKRLLDILREDLDLIAAKEGCGKGECGACTVLLDDRRVNSCLVPAFQLSGSSVLTLEWLREQPFYHHMEEIFTRHGSVQCGFCFPGIVMSTASLLVESPVPLTEEHIREGLAGNICRCTGYSRIISAVTEITKRSDIINNIRKVCRHE
jgi:carbon-monoxide dehydrogenase small subunit